MESMGGGGTVHHMQTSSFGGVYRTERAARKHLLVD